ncbi:MAG: site-specific integrase [Sulfuricella denitrificans]|nr:site-specific integrase [Sulfuricella denitrificans]
MSASAVFRTKAEAEAWAARHEHEISARRAGMIPDKTFGDLLARYIREVLPTKRGERPERLRLQRMIDGADPLVSVRLDDIDAEHFASWRDRRLASVSAASVLREWSTLGHACQVAIKEWRWLYVHPMQGVTKPEPHKPRARRISDDEVERILFASGYDYDVIPITAQSRAGAALLFAIETAMRAGEICGMKWSDVDLDRRVVHLPKTKNGYSRDVPMSKEAIRILLQLQGIDAESVFALKAESLDTLFRKARDRALIEGLHFHDSRREALTRMAAKVDVMTLAKISGHRDLRILLATYYAPNMSDVAGMLD